MPIDTLAGGSTPRSLFAAALQSRWPGVLLCSVIAMAASFIARLHGGPQLLYALLFGVSFHFLHDDAKIRPGIELCTGQVLRLGVALLGARITVAQIAALGWSTALIVVGCVLSTIVGGMWVARRLGLSTTQGLLSGGATAICGASAALAISAVLPRSREQERFTLLVVVAVTSLSTIAMLLYPLLVHALHLSPALAGLFLGGSIHDVAQVVGAGYLMGQETGDAATIVKLFRVSMLALVVIVVSAAYRGRRLSSESAGAPQRPALVPWFLWVFLLLVAVHSLHAIPEVAQPWIGDVSRGCLVVAIAALGVKTSFQMLLQTGWRPFALLLIETVWLAAALLLSILMSRTS
ncbi:MAG: putative sulfate exporter family transporter [Burkholderiales bacterium]